MPTPSDPRPRVFMAMPHYGQVHADAAAAFHLRPTLGGVRIARHFSPSSSVLEHTFNICLMAALDARDNGEADLFVMLHSDVAPLHAGWVDVLARRLAEERATVVSAVVPLKDGSGRTSTAIGLGSDPWGLARHVLLSDRDAMPETFGPADACDPGSEVLLLNTGCWVADLSHPFWDRCSFRVESRIRREPAPGGGTAYTAEFRPEDWELSRDLQAAGAEIRGTWAVPLRHHGVSNWPSHPDEPGPEAE